MIEIVESQYWRVTLVIIALPIMILSQSRRMLHEKRGRGSVTLIKKLVLIAFFIDLYGGLSKLVFIAGWLDPVAPWYSGSTNQGIGLNTLATSLTATLGLFVVFYLFNIERLQYTPVYGILAIILYFFISGGHSEIYPYYVYIGGISALILMYIAAFKLRDNYALGLAVFYTLGILDVAMFLIDNGPITIPVAANLVAMYAFGIYFSLGKFKPFKTVQPLQLPQLESTPDVSLPVQVEIEEA